MLDMSQINHIKDLSNCGYRISEINEKTGKRIYRDVPDKFEYWLKSFTIKEGIEVGDE